MLVKKRSKIWEDEKERNEKKQRLVSPGNSSVRRGSCLEDLSNEVFFEIFEYLEGQEMIKTFSNLNNRFEKLVNDPKFPFKLHRNHTIRENDEYYWKHIVSPNAHRLVSLNFSHVGEHSCFFYQWLLNESFNRLAAVTVSSLETWDEVLMILFQLKSLPRLSHLYMDLPYEYSPAISAAYLLFLSLASLKTLTIGDFIDIDPFDRIEMPRLINQTPSSIQSLTICHNLTINELLSLLQCTPYLCQLNCDGLLSSAEQIDQTKVQSLQHLKSISTTSLYVEFDIFEDLLQMIGQTVTVLNLNIEYIDKNYLSATRWEQLIKKDIPNLRKFALEYKMFPKIENRFLNDLINQFNSPFWLQLHSSFKIILGVHPIAFLMTSKTKPWFEMHRQIDPAFHSKDGSVQNMYVTLIVNEWSLDVDSEKVIYNLINVINQNSTHCCINELKIDTPNDPFDLGMILVQALPNADSLFLRCDFDFESPIISSYLLRSEVMSSEKNKITKLKIDNAITEKQIYDVLYYFFRLEYFETGCKAGIDLARVTSNILNNPRIQCPNLRSICFIVKGADDNMTRELIRRIENNTSISVLTVKRIGEQIFVQWTKK